MVYRYEYTNASQRQALIDQNQGKILVEEQNLLDGDYLLFADGPLPEEISLIQEVEVLKARDARMQQDISLILEFLGG